MKIIGISGLAGDGKDTVCKILHNFFLEKTKYQFYRISLADKLKLDCREACVDLFGVNPLYCSREQKDKIRDFLVFYGKIMRFREPKGTYWTSEAYKKILEIANEKTIICVPDIRYATYPEDECQWIKKNNGIHIHVKKFKLIPDFSFGKTTGIKKVYSIPVNAEEETNTPIVEKMADYILEWQDCSPQSPENNKAAIKAVYKIAEQINDTYMTQESQSDTQKAKKPSKLSQKVGMPIA